MENNYFTTYKFENYDVEGLKLKINFANAEFLEIKTHEEIDTQILFMKNNFFEIFSYEYFTAKYIIPLLA